MKKIITLCLGSALLSGAGVAQLSPLLEYRFPASYNGTATADAAPVADQSAAGTDAKAYWRYEGSMPALSEEAPPGAPAGARSLDLAVASGSIRTDAGNILLREKVIEYGGFTFDVWFKGMPTDTPTSRAAKKLIDNGGYEFISVSNHDGDADGSRGEVFVRLSTTGNSWALDVDDGLLMDEWNHVTFAFTLKDASNPASIVGDVLVVLNGTVRTFADKILTNTSETNNNPPRPLGIGRHPVNNSEYYEGLLYNPSVYYGVAPIAEPVATLTSSGAHGFTITVKDGSVSPVDTSTVAVTLNGTALAQDVSVSKEGDLTTITYAPPAGVPGGLHAVNLTFRNQAGATSQAAFGFTVLGSVSSTLLKYTFPESYAGDGGSSLVDDQGPAGHDAEAIGVAGLPVLSDVTPPGAPASARSLDLRELEGGLRTTENKLLSNPAIVAGGGFVYDVWFFGVPENPANVVQKIVDYAGTQFIGVSGYDHDSDGSPGEVVVRLGATANTYRLDADDGLNVQGWNHFIMAYTVTNASNLDALVGNLALVLNGKTTSFNGQSLSTAGDALNRPLAIGAHPTGGERYRGLIYAPTVYLGVPPSDPPAFSLQASKASGLVVTLEDSGSSQINASTLSVTLDGAALPVSLVSAGGQHSFEHLPEPAFTPGRHLLVAHYQDAAGAHFYQVRSFSILGKSFAPVLRYEFPASYDGGTPAGDVLDLSDAGHNAKANGPDATTPLALSTDIPPGQPGENLSADFKTTLGNIITTNASLLNRPLVIAHGGYTYDVWFKGIPAVTTLQKIIDYAGTEHISVRNGAEGDPVAGEVVVNVGNALGMTLDHTAGLDPLGWNHIVVSYEVLDELNPAGLTGTLKVTLNDVESVREGVTLSAYGDTFDRPVGIGSHPTGGEKYTGLLYHPAIYYGVPDATTPGADPAISLSVQGANAVITFEGVLESSDDLTDFQPVPGAASPYTTPLSGARYFRAAAP